MEMEEMGRLREDDNKKIVVILFPNRDWHGHPECVNNFRDGVGMVHDQNVARGDQASLD